MVFYSVMRPTYKKIKKLIAERAGDYSRFSQELDTLEDLLGLPKKKSHRKRREIITGLEKKAQIYQDLLNIKGRYRDPLINHVIDRLREVFPYQFEKMEEYL